MTNLPEMNAIQKALDEIFKSFDFDGSGTVDKDDFTCTFLMNDILGSADFGE